MTTQAHVPAEPEASARPAPRPGPGPALPLAYATPQPQGPAADFGDYLIAAVRRLVFAVGVGLLVGGVMEGFADRPSEDAVVPAGIGAGLVAVVVPFRKLSQPIRLSRRD